MTYTPCHHTAVQCPVLTAPTNGGVSGGNSYGDVATFTCDSGYSLSGSATLTCQADTTWDGASPTCAAGLCPTLTSPTNGAVSGSNSLGDVATFTCDSGYNLVGGSTRTCQTDLSWSGSSPTCTAVQCPVLTAPTNGGVSGGNSYGDVATFTCDSGYSLSGSATLTCQADTTWNGASPTCAAGLCPTLTPPTNGAVSGSNSLGDVATFTCNSGYNLVGGSTRTCQADLSWSGSSPTCTAVQCPVLTAPTNGGVSGGNSYGDVATFTCDSGYSLSGSATLTCQVDTTWNGASPTCAAVQCPVLTAPTNGGVSGGNSYGDVATFTCDSGYSLSGSATLTCQADTTWDGASPTCAAGLCPTLTSPTNGAVSGSNSLGDVATFTCDAGYNLVGGSTRTCQADLSWSGSSPTCTAVQCPVLTAPTNGGVSGGNSYGDVATFTCDSGYSLSGSATLTCQADTTWDGASPTCAAGLCPTLTSPTNGAVSGSNSLGDVATFTCDAGYNLVGGSTRTCQADLSWSGSSPTCTAVQCPVLTAPTNGGVSGGNSYGDVATFTCDSGYSLSGSATLTCQADTTWNGASPTCAAGLCPTLTSPTNGAVSGSNSLGDVATFTCDAGYNLVGGSTRTCQADLSWSGTSPTCTAVQCPVLTAPTNGGVSGGNSYGDVATFTCDSGYSLSGSATLTCQADTTWNGASPTCTAGQCPAPSSPTNGFVSGTNSLGDTITFTCNTGYNMAGSSTLTSVQCPVLTAPTNGGVSGGNSYGDVATFTCDSGYSLSGLATLTCQADTTWDGTSPTCTIGQCPAPTSPTNGGVTGTYSFGDTITFTCNTGYNMAGSSTLTCQSDLTWNGSPSTCTIVQCSAQSSPTNGGVSGGNSYGDVATFTCNTGYHMVGTSALSCQADGTWTGTAPTCLIVQCPVQTAPDNGGMSGTNNYQDVVQFTCNSGYDMTGAASTTCQADGTWSNSAPTCGAVQCPLLTAPTNGAMTGSNFYQDVVQFTCNSGYELVGRSSLTCQADATWDGTIPTCSRRY
ncbi:sushi, von Willebrand factor type A, EGF and pentraxin domain-containing protein 1-like [Branchiostoma floridae x Branchiostoma japonicum]